MHLGARIKVFYRTLRPRVDPSVDAGKGGEPLHDLHLEELSLRVTQDTTPFI